MIRLPKLNVAVGLLLLSAGASLAQDRPSIVTVNYALQYFAERLVGDAAEVVFPVPQGVDPSFWRPSIADISEIQSADLILLNGAGFATWVDQVTLPRSKTVNTSAAIEEQFIVTESITHSHGDGGEHSHEGLATYIWLDPTLAVAQAEAIAAALDARQIAPLDVIGSELETLRADLIALDDEAKTALAAVQGVAIIATHPRYQYFARRYDLSMSSLEWEAGAIPTEVQLANLEVLVRDTGAQIMVWEAEPPIEAFEATAALGLRNVVFPPFANAVGDKNPLQTFSDAVSALSNAMAN